MCLSEIQGLRATGHKWINLVEHSTNSAQMHRLNSDLAEHICLLIHCLAMLPS